MAEKKAAEKEKAPEKAAPTPDKGKEPAKPDKAVKKEPDKAAEPPKRRGRPPKETQAKTPADKKKTAPAKEPAAPKKTSIWNLQRLGRELMTTSEITTMPGDKCILQLRGLPPFLSPKYDLKKHPNYRYTAEFDKKKNAFHLESLFRRRPLRLKPEDEYTVYEVEETDTDEEADLLNFDDLNSDEFV